MILLPNGTRGHDINYQINNSNIDFCIRIYYNVDHKKYQPYITEYNKNIPLNHRRDFGVNFMEGYSIVCSNPKLIPLLPVSTVYPFSSMYLSAENIRFTVLNDECPLDMICFFREYGMCLFEFSKNPRVVIILDNLKGYVYLMYCCSFKKINHT